MNYSNLQSLWTVEVQMKESKLKIIVQKTYTSILDLSDTVLQKLIEVSDNIPDNLFQDIWQSLQTAGVTGIAIGWAVCADWTKVAGVYYYTTEWEAILTWVTVVGSCSVWWVIAAWWVITLGAWMLMAWDGSPKWSTWTWWKPNRYPTKTPLDGSKDLYYTTDGKWRVDVEAPNGGKWWIHIQSMLNNGVKYFYNYGLKKFFSDDWFLAPRSVQKLLDNPYIQNALEKWKTYLLTE